MLLRSCSRAADRGQLHQRQPWTLPAVSCCNTETAICYSFALEVSTLEVAVCSAHGRCI